jgi:hypothetical protein
MEPTAKQLAEMLGVSVAYITTAIKLSAKKRAAILAGHDRTSFAALQSPPAPCLTLPTLKPGVGDDELIKLARNIGPERLFQAIEAVI